MGTTEILLVIALVGITAVIILLAMLLRRMKDISRQDDRQNDREMARRIMEGVAEQVNRSQREAMSSLRGEMQNELRANRTELSGNLNGGLERLGQTLRENQHDTSRRQEERLIELVRTQNQIFELQDKRLSGMQESLTALLSEKMDSIGGSVSAKLGEIDKQFRELKEQNRREQEDLRRILEERLQLMQTQNARQLEEMRATVDEKLQKTLDERISQSFKMVNERLAEVYKGLGEMQTLAGSVGDLKKVISGVKTRGILGELQLGAIMEDMLSPEQYEVNIPTKRGSANRVEYAIRLPGDDAPIYLPIDAKFPADAYTHLLDAYDVGDPDKIKEAGTVFEIGRAHV